MSRYSPAALALMSAGVTVSSLADELDTTATTVSRWLAGQHPAPAQLFETIERLGDEHLADEVRRHVRESVAA